MPWSSFCWQGTGVQEIQFPVSDCSGRAGFWNSNNFPTNIRPQNRPSSLDACVPSNRRPRKELLQTNAIIPAISGHRGIPRWGQKGGNLLQMWKRSDVVCVQMWYQHWGTQLFLILQAFLMVLEKWAVKLCNQKKKAFKIHSQSLIPQGWFFYVVFPFSCCVLKLLPFSFFFFFFFNAPCNKTWRSVITFESNALCECNI